MKQNNTKITGIILAGGTSRRMGSDKATKCYLGKAFIQYSIDALKPLVDHIIIVSNNTAHAEFGYDCVADIIENAGPLSGLYSGLQASTTEANIVLSCDVPLLTSVVLKPLLQPQYNTAIRVLKTETRTMPLIGYYEKSCQDILFQLLQQGERRMMKVLEVIPTTTINIETALAYQLNNINTLMDLKQITHDH